MQSADDRNRLVVQYRLRCVLSLRGAIRHHADALSILEAWLGSLLSAKGEGQQTNGGLITAISSLMRDPLCAADATLAANCALLLMDDALAGGGGVKTGARAAWRQMVRGSSTLASLCDAVMEGASRIYSGANWDDLLASSNTRMEIYDKMVSLIRDDPTRPWAREPRCGRCPSHGRAHPSTTLELVHS